MKETAPEVLCSVSWRASRGNSSPRSSSTRTNLTRLGIGEIVLTGGTVHLHGLAEQLQGLIGVNVRSGDPLGRVTVGKKIKNAEQVGSLAIAIGLGIED